MHSMTKNKDDKPTIRNWVKKAADELGIKPSRHRDRKREAKNELPKDFLDYKKSSRIRKSDDYDRSQRRREERGWGEPESTPIPAARRKGERGERLAPDKDRSRHYERELDSIYWPEPEEDSPDSEEVQ